MTLLQLFRKTGYCIKPANCQLAVNCTAGFAMVI